MGRRPIIAPRKPVFVGCEGDSEQAYGQVLNDMLRERSLPFHLEVVNLGSGAGDPVTRLHKSAQELERRKQRRSRFKLRVAFLDSDQVDGDRQRRQQAEKLAQENGIRIIWQEPCHEAFLLRHVDGFSNHRPPTSARAVAMLKSNWPDYHKPMTRIQLARRITFDALLRVAAVEPALFDFLRDIELLDHKRQHKR